MGSVNRSRLRSTIIRANGYFESISGRTQILHVGFTGECRPLTTIDPNVTPNGGGSNAIHIFGLIIPVKSIPGRMYRFRFDPGFDRSMDTGEGGEDSVTKE